MTNEKLGIIAALLTTGADIDARGNEGKTALVERNIHLPHSRFLRLRRMLIYVMILLLWKASCLDISQNRNQVTTIDSLYSATIVHAPIQALLNLISHL